MAGLSPSGLPAGCSRGHGGGRARPQQPGWLKSSAGCH